MSKQGGVFLDTATGQDFLDESTQHDGNACVRFKFIWDILASTRVVCCVTIKKRI